MTPRAAPVAAGRSAPGYYDDDVAAAHHRVTRIAAVTGRAPAAVAPLSRRNARVWQIRCPGTDPQVVKLACGRTAEQVGSEAAALAREVQVVRVMHDADLLPYTIADFGGERRAAATTWTLTDQLPGCRASVVVRNACHGDADVLDLCARILREIARLHHADPGLLAEIPVDRSLLDRPIYGAVAREAEWVVTAVRRLRAQAPGLVACHGDGSLHNVLASTDRVYLIDWACARLDLPSLDLAPIFVWLAHHTADDGACREFVSLIREAYRDHHLNPFVGVGEHIARVLLQWAAWRGPGYASVAARVAGATSPDGVAVALFDGLDAVRRVRVGAHREDRI